MVGRDFEIGRILHLKSETPKYGIEVFGTGCAVVSAHGDEPEEI